MTGLALSPQPATGSVLMQITGAPSTGAAVYTQGFETSTDSWVPTATGGASSAAMTRVAGGRTGSWRVDLTWTQAAGSGGSGRAYISRTITGLTVGVLYRASAWLRIDASTANEDVFLEVVGRHDGLDQAVVGQWRQVLVDFTATATSHVIRLGISPGIIAVTGTARLVAIDDVAVNVAPPGPTTITRVDGNGTGPVRLLSGQEPIGGTLTVTDFEPALAGPVRYDVRDGAGVITSATTALVGVDRPRLHVPVLPQFSQTLWAVRDLTQDRASSTTVHEVIGRPDRIATIGSLRPRQGQLTMMATDRAAAEAVTDLYERGEVVMLRLPEPGIDLYHVPTSVSLSPEHLALTHDGDTRRWSINVAYAEVSPPAGPLLGAAGWTFASITAVGSFAALRATFPTFADLVVGL